jgi:hypothetical protein
VKSITCVLRIVLAKVKPIFAVLSPRSATISNKEFRWTIPAKRYRHKTPKSDQKKPKSGSAVGVSCGSLPVANGRSGWPRLARDCFRRLLVHCGGENAVSEPQRLLARRIATLEAVLVYLEEDFAVAHAANGRPDPTVLALYGTLADRQRRLAEPLGWQRGQRDVTGQQLTQPTQWTIVDPAPLGDGETLQDAPEDTGDTDLPTDSENQS